MKIGIALDDWKLPVFRKRLSESGFTYKDGGALSGGVTLLTVETDEVTELQIVVRKCQLECKGMKRS